MRNTVKLTLLALMTAFTSCKNEQMPETASVNSEGNTTITHTLGTTSVPAHPQRVAVLDFAAAETLTEMGISIIGMPKSAIPKHLEQYKDDQSVVDLGTLKEIDYEKLNELNPDVIFMSARLQNDYPEISKIAPTVYTEIEYKDYVNSIEKNLAIYGEVFEQKETTDKVLNDIKDKINSVSGKMKESDKKALIVLFNNGKFSAYGKGSRFGIIHDVLGIKEAVEDLEVTRHGQAVSNEFIQEANPDYLYVIDRSAVIDHEATDREAIENKLIQQTNAYKNGKIIYLNPEIWYLSGGGITSIIKMIDEVEESL